jgi:hypothetical protein
MDSSAQSTATAIDHVGLVGHDVADLRATYTRLGFTVTSATPEMQPSPDGKREIPLGQLTAHIAFPTSCIELTAVRHPGQGNHLDKWLARRAGLHVFALHAENVTEAYETLVSAGLIMTPPRSSIRRVTGNGVKAKGRFTWFALPESIAQEAFSRVMQHDTPEVVFDPRLTHHANGANGIRSVFAVVDNMDEAFARYKRLPGTKHRSFAIGRTILMNQQQFVVMERRGFGAMFPGLDIPAEPHLGGYALTVADIDYTRTFLTKAGVYFRNWGEQGIWIPPEDAGGAVLALVDQSAPV